MRLWAVSQLLPAKAWSYFYQYNEFARIAWALASGHGYSSPWANTPLLPTAIEPPAYSFLLAGIFKMAGVYALGSLWIAVVLNAVFSSANAVLILRAGKRDFTSSAAVLAAWVWSCWTYEAVVAIRLWESSLTALLLMLALLWLPRVERSTRTSPWLLFGVLAGFAGLTNTTLLAIIPAFALWTWIECRRRGQPRGPQLLAFCAVFLIVLVPWTIRNYIVFHRLMPVRDNFGLELWLGNHPSPTAASDNDFPVLDPTAYNQLGEIRFMERKREMALRFIYEQPQQFLRRSLHRVWLFWIEPVKSAWGEISVLAWLGCFLAWRKRKAIAVPYAIVMILFPTVYYITHTYDTYRHPMEPVIILLACYAVTEITATMGRRLRLPGWKNDDVLANPTGPSLQCRAC